MRKEDYVLKLKFLIGSLNEMAYHFFMCGLSDLLHNDLGAGTACVAYHVCVDT